jgi:hypothetical protein
VGPLPLVRRLQAGGRVIIITVQDVVPDDDDTVLLPDGIGWGAE